MGIIANYQYLSDEDLETLKNLDNGDDIFEKVEDYSGECEEFKYVISRSPHDSPLHMHLRYGDNVEDLLNMSKNPKDDKFNPWWAEYIYANKKWKMGNGQF